MNFPVGVLDTVHYHSKIDTLLADKNCSIIFDTNLFSQLFKLYPIARTEFYSWADKCIADDRVAIPNWSVHEYIRRFVTNSLVSYVDEVSQLRTINTTLKYLESFLKMYVDDSMLKNSPYKMKDDYFRDLSDAITKLERVANATIPVKEFISDLNAELKGRFDKVVMPSNIHRISSEIYTEAVIRRENEIPPGFQDDGKEKNKYGDLVIWKEILDYCQIKNEPKPF